MSPGKDDFVLLQLQCNDLNRFTPEQLTARASWALQIGQPITQGLDTTSPEEAMLQYIQKIIQYILPYGIVHQAQKRSGWYFQKPDRNYRPLHKQHAECIVLVNGPSVATQLQSLRNYMQHADILTVNHSLMHESYRQLHPMAHFLFDPAFFRPGPSLESFGGYEKHKAAIIAMLAAVDWKMTLYVPACFYEDALLLGYENDFVSVATAPVTYPPKHCPRKRAYRLMDKGIYGGGAQSVSNVPIYMAIAARYKKVWIAGLDGIALTSLRTDECCRVFREETHCYGEDQVIWLHHTFPATLSTMAKWAEELEQLKKYAEYNGVPLVNLSVHSLFDFAPKGELGADPYPFIRNNRGGPH